VIDHFAKTGDSLRKAVSSYNDGVRSLETRLIPSVRKFRDLGISSAKEVSSPGEVDQVPKPSAYLAAEFRTPEESGRLL